MLMTALAQHDAASGFRVVVCVPQTVIARTFDARRIRLSDGTVLDWNPTHRLIDSPSTVARLRGFFESKLPSGINDRIVVCTHHALVAAYSSLKKSRKLGCLRNVSLFIDEGHHSGFGGDGETNRLGSIVEHYLDKKPGPLLLGTATWLRSDTSDILPPEAVDAFSTYVRHVDEHINDLTHLKSIKIRAVVSPSIPQALGEIFKGPRRKSIVYLPPVQSIVLQGSTKSACLSECKDALGKQRLDDGYLERWGKHRVLDYVTVSDRDERKAAFDEALRETGKEPDVLFALNLGMEGFDWPAAERAVILGPRGSLGQCLQMLGRVMRDHPNKSGAEFIVVVPSDDEDRQTIKQYIQVMVMNLLLEWQITLVPIEDGAARLARRHVDLVSNVLDEYVEQNLNGRRDVRLEEVVEGVAERSGGRVDPEQMTRGIRSLFTQSLKKRLDAEESKGSIQLPPEMTWLNGLAVTLTGSGLASLRDRMGARHLLSQSYIQEKIREYRNDTGRWPNGASGVIRGDGRTWMTVDSALRTHYRSSLAKLCRQLGKPPALTLDYIKRKILEHHRDRGRWPVSGSDTISRDGRAWGSVNCFLAKQHRTTLSALCRELGKPPPLTVDYIEQRVRQVHEETGIWPNKNSGKVPGDGRTWSHVHVILKTRHQTTLSRVCERLGKRRRLEPGYIGAKAQEFHEKAGRWPTSNDLIPGDGRKWNSASMVLRKQTGRGLPDLVYELSGGSVLLEHVQVLVVAYRKRTGRWPTKKGATGSYRISTWPAVDRWLAANRRGGLDQYCASLESRPGVTKVGGPRRVIRAA